MPYLMEGQDAIVKFRVQRLGYMGDLQCLGGLESSLDPPQNLIQLEPYA